MSDILVKEWNKAKRAVSEAKQWNDLPNGRKYQRQDTFEISVGHCTAPVLKRMGQQYAGGTNYWETSQEFSQAILQHLVENWSNIYPEVIKIMEEKEKKALIACQEYVSMMQNMISQAQGESK